MPCRSRSASACGAGSAKGSARRCAGGAEERPVGRGGSMSGPPGPDDLGRALSQLPDVECIRDAIAARWPPPILSIEGIRAAIDRRHPK